jgi:hypothetical protein
LIDAVLYRKLQIKSDNLVRVVELRLNEEDYIQEARSSGIDCKL